jgi:hypothetical protein
MVSQSPDVYFARTGDSKTGQPTTIGRTSPQVRQALVAKTDPGAARYPHGTPGAGPAQHRPG